MVLWLQHVPQNKSDKRKEKQTGKEDRIARDTGWEQRKLVLTVHLPSHRSSHTVHFLPLMTAPPAHQGLNKPGLPTLLHSRATLLWVLSLLAISHEVGATVPWRASSLPEARRGKVQDISRTGVWSPWLLRVLPESTP